MDETAHKGRMTNLITSYEKITISGNKYAEVFLNITEDKRFIISIPSISWSAEISQLDELKEQFNHLQSSLNFHMFEGNTEELAAAIIKEAEKHI
ncbi:hypothetical protein B14911_25315 [Bacillus sp. NRRL B-14911]|uniref:Uncharacterized protein n=2 Tax=Bacillus infantis TaxID=324767 RepID=U5LDV1_9BACI|nr:hypothetical protein N288_14855 [Bacillus infantis NRRL B-14911]EAR68040.1 hypothetical protein B14911_25315 [Bacillus sp. NRRL B-14911]OXT18325.1 hypothetical protein B9K06_07440 [Bacillus sp. OG2]